MRRPGQPPGLRQRLAEAILKLDPTHEEACRDVMRGSAEAGDTIGALRAYDQLWQLLEDDYDTEPSAPTQALVADIKLGRIAPWPMASPRLPRPPDRRPPPSPRRWPRRPCRAPPARRRGSPCWSSPSP
ncbi:bacterial transcriptional activator domain-containing protein [Paeniroseomonas aquatica]|uniref:bacterial transcriptional activator domain-containing protein n=1 Tax=Paeniroseomonas aquatica TaxID=373043 RepID=UPI00360C0B6F